MDKKLKSESAALVLLLAAFPIISMGSTAGNPAIWWIGLLAFIAGGVLPVLTRFMDHSRDRIRDMGMEFDERTS